MTDSDAAVRAGTIKAALLKMSGPGGRDRVFCVPDAQGLAASTRFQVLLQAGGGGDGGQKVEPVSLVALWPSEGRTHQLRVHCAEKLGRGCYIIGDAKYGQPSKPRFPSAISYKYGHGAQVRERAWGLEDRTAETVFDNESRAWSPAQPAQAGARRWKTRLCLHALRLTVNVAPDERELVLAERDGTRPGWDNGTLIDCVAEVPEHMLVTSEDAGISRGALHAALGPLLPKKAT